MKKIIFLYGYYPGDNKKGRPSYYSKELALRSFTEAYNCVDCDKNFILAVDGTTLSDSIKKIVSGNTDEIVYLGGLGNSKSYLKVLDIIEAAASCDYFYVSEDDYLYKKDSFTEFVNAMASICCVDYITLYDHPDRYFRTDNQTPLCGEKIFISGKYHWRTVESTCMTFGGRIESLKKDMHIHRGFSSKYKPWWDRKIWYKTQGLGRYLWRFPKRRLIAPMPSLATHLEEAYLAPLIDWELLAKQLEN